MLPLFGFFHEGARIFTNKKNAVFPVVSPHFRAFCSWLTGGFGGRWRDFGGLPVAGPRARGGEPGYFLYCLISVAGGYALWEGGFVRGFYPRRARRCLNNDSVSE